MRICFASLFTFDQRESVWISFVITKTYMQILKKYWNEKPLTVILLAAIFFRLIAVIFSKGFGMHDDHFLVIEAAQSWVDGMDYNNWLPGSKGNTGPTGHSFFYVGLHYLLLSFIDFIGINDPQFKMFIVRFLHAVFSLLTVILGYKITAKLYDKNSAKTVGLLLAILWFMPFLSVRNLVEVTCIPFVLYGIWILISYKTNKIIFFSLFAGFVLGLAFSIRYQTIIFTGGVGLALLIQKKWKEAIGLGVGFAISVFLIQGIIDIFIWGYPFAELNEYIRYNVENAYNYNIIAWYSYLLLILGILIPPVSFFLFYGFLRTWKKHFLIFLPTILFLVFHSYFPNKQERFILPIIPFIIILGIIGWNKFVEKSKFWNRNKKLLKACWIFFWTINLILLPVISTMYSKKARVESMVYLSKYENIKYILLEDTNNDNAKICPRFYLNQWSGEYRVTQQISLKVYPEKIWTEKNSAPGFVLFFEEKNINNRVNSIKTVLPNIEYEATIEPGFVDNIMHWLNPINANQIIYIYRNTDIYTNKLP